MHSSFYHFNHKFIYQQFTASLTKEGQYTQCHVFIFKDEKVPLVDLAQSEALKMSEDPNFMKHFALSLQRCLPRR